MSMENAPDVSVVIPVYNTDRYLEECLDAVLSQTLQSIEVICIDDGSTDGSARLLDEIADRDSRVRVVHQENAGVSRSRNVGLGLSRGAYVLFVDSDDYIELNACEKLFNIAQRESADIVVFGGEAFPGVGWIDRCLDTPDIVYKGNGFRALFSGRGSYPLMCNKLYRRGFVEEYGLRFNEGLRLGEDNAFQFCSFPHAKTVVFCSDRFYHYRCEREGSALNTFYDDRLEKVRLHFAVIEYVFSQWEEQDLLQGHELDLLGWACEFLFDDIQFMNFGQREMFAREFEGFLQNHGLAGFISQLEGIQEEACSFILGPLSVHDGSPHATIVVSGVSSDRFAAECLASLGNQSDQHIQILLFDEGASEGDSLLRRRFASNDRRAMLIPIEDGSSFADSLERAMTQVNGEYILFAGANCQYDRHFIARAVAGAKKTGADIVTAYDAARSLRWLHMARSLHMLSDTKGTGVAEDREVFAPRDDPSRTFTFSSLSSWNKLYRTDYVKAGGAHSDDPYFVGKALLECDAVLPLNEVLLEVRPFDTADPGHLRYAAERIERGLRDLGEFLDKPGWTKAREKSFVSATLTSFLCYLDCIHDAERARAICPAFIRSLRTLVDIEQRDKSWFFEGSDYEKGLSLLSLSVGEYLQQTSAKELVDLRSQVTYLEREIVRQRLDIEEFYGSISYRTGRVVTAIPRGMVSLLRKARNH